MFIPLFRTLCSLWKRNVIPVCEIDRSTILFHHSALSGGNAALALQVRASGVQLL
jgi:hypothetical protein